MKKSPGTAIGAAGIVLLGPAALPLGLLAPHLIDQFVEQYKNRPDPDALPELFRESLLSALNECVRSLDELKLTEEERTLLKLWETGLGVSAKKDRMWARMLEEEVPASAVRLTSVDLNQSSSFWALLRSFLEECTYWFRYRKTAGSEGLGFHVPRDPLILSRYLEDYLAANLPRLVVKKFRPEISSPEHETAFRQAVLDILSRLDREVSPLDPLRTQDEYLSFEQATQTIQLLEAQYRAIPYIGRESDFERLLEWLSSPPPVSFQVVVGSGGSGKTRFAYRFIERVYETERRSSWRAGMLPPERFQHALTSESVRRWRGPTLIVIDYAASSAEWLRRYVVPELSNYGLTDPSLPPLRFLLLERGADQQLGWYASLRRAAGGRKDDLFPRHPLDLAPLGPRERYDLLEAALGVFHKFEAHRSQPAEERLVLPSYSADSQLGRLLANERKGNPLELMMAALVAHKNQDLAVLETVLDRGRIHLARQIAEHEYHRLERIADARGNRPFLLLHLAAYITLAGSLERRELRPVCEAEKDAVARDSHWEINDLVEVLVTSALPSADPSKVDPMTPDIIGEAFLLLVLREHDDADARDTVFRASVTNLQRVTRILIHLIQDLAFPTEESKPEDKPRNESDQAWVLKILTDLLRDRAEALRADFWTIHKALPFDTVVMRKPASDFYRAIVEAETNTPRGEIALEARESYAIFQSKLRTGDPLREMRDVIAGRHERAKSGDDKSLGELASSLLTQATIQGQMIQRSNALASIEEAVACYHRLTLDSHELLPGLARALNTRATLQNEMNKRSESLRSVLSAVKYLRRLDKSDSGFRPALALSLSNLATAQAGMNKRTKALRSISQSVNYYSGLVNENRDAWLQDLAAALNNLAKRQMGIELRLEAVGSSSEAVRHCRELVSKNRMPFLSDLARSLNTLANAQIGMHKWNDAIEFSKQALDIWEEQRRTQPDDDVLFPDLADSLTTRADAFMGADQWDEALDCVDKAVNIRESLVKQYPQEFRPDLAISLNSRANVYIGMNRLGDALETIGSAVNIRKDLVEECPDAFQAALAESLGVKSKVHLLINELRVALHLSNEAEEILCPLAEAIPNAFALDLAVTYETSGRVYTALGDGAEAVKKFEAGIRSIVPLARQLPSVHCSQVVRVWDAYTRACSEASISPEKELTRLVRELGCLRDSPTIN